MEKFNEPLKMWVYGKPFAGKTHFATQFPKPLVLSTDGNARFYNVDYKPINDLDDFNKAMTFVLSGEHEYETIILDVTEHLYDYVRDYYLGKKNVDDESEMGGYAIGWRLIRNGFWSIIKRLANTDYNVIFISHEETVEVKDALGRISNEYRPALTHHLHDKMSGNVQLVGRVYQEQTMIGGDVISKHYISFGSNGSSELSGVRIPIKELKIDNSYEAFINNIKTGGQ